MNVTETNTIVLPLSELHENKGQIAGVPRNPRILKNERYKALLASLKEDNLTGVIPLKVYNNNGEWVVIGGNMRLKALRELGASEVSCIIIPKDMPTAKLCKMVIIDNATFGDWDMDALADEWDADSLDNWGVDVPDFNDPDEDVKINAEKIKPSEEKSQITVATVTLFGQTREAILYRQLTQDETEQLLAVLQEGGADSVFNLMRL